MNRIVIVAASLGGLAAVEALRRPEYRGALTLVGGEPLCSEFSAAGPRVYGVGDVARRHGKWHSAAKLPPDRPMPSTRRHRLS